MKLGSFAAGLKGANAFKMRNRAISNYAFENLMSNQKDVRLPIRTPDGICPINSSMTCHIQLDYFIFQGYKMNAKKKTLSFVYSCREDPYQDGFCALQA